MTVLQLRIQVTQHFYNPGGSFRAGTGWSLGGKGVSGETVGAWELTPDMLATVPDTRGSIHQGQSCRQGEKTETGNGGQMSGGTRQ